MCLLAIDTVSFFLCIVVALLRQERCSFPGGQHTFVTLLNVLMVFCGELTRSVCGGCLLGNREQ